MFDRLVVSAKDRRRGRTGKILFLTSVFYSLAIASALVVSVVAASPMLEDTSEMARFTPVIPAPPLPPKGNEPIVHHGRPPQTPRPSIYNPAPLETLTNPATQSRLVRGIPNLSNVGDVSPGGVGDPNGVEGGDPFAPSSIGVIGGSGREIGPPPAPPTPPPVTKPKPEPQPEKQLLRLPSTVLSGKAVTRKTPDYPSIAKQIKLQGAITVEVMITSDGRVESARALGGHPLLVRAAVDAAYGWRFQPTLLNGVAVRVTGVITFNFTLN